MAQFLFNLVGENFPSSLFPCWMIVSCTVTQRRFLCFFQTLLLPLFSCLLICHTLRHTLSVPLLHIANLRKKNQSLFIREKIKFCFGLSRIHYLSCARQALGRLVKLFIFIELNVSDLWDKRHKLTKHLVLKILCFRKPTYTLSFTIITFQSYISLTKSLNCCCFSPPSPPHSLHLSWKHRTQIHVNLLSTEKENPSQQKKKKQMKRTRLLTELWIWHRKWERPATPLRSLSFTSPSVSAHHHHHFSFSHGIHFT